MTNHPHDEMQISASGQPKASAPGKSAGRAAIEEICSWARQVEDYGWPHFDEFSQRLNAVRSVILGSVVPSCTTQQFEQQTEPESEVHQSPDNPLAPESALARKQADLVRGYDQLIRQLQGEHLCFVSWQAACRAFGTVCEQYDALEKQLNQNN